MKWSEQQREIFDAYRTTDSNLCIAAGPGSGKTTVLKQLCKLTPLSQKSIFLAFNRSIVDELRLKLPASTEVSTLHGLGCRTLYKEYGNVKVVETKTFGYLKKVLEKKWEEDLQTVKNVNYYFFELTQIYDLYRMNVLDKVDERIENLSYRHGHDWDDTIAKHLTELVDTMKKVNRVVRGIFEIDYVDMIYLPIAKNLTLPRYSRVFLDEAQDLNVCQHLLVEKLLGREGRLISVGDENQCIYSFLGASPESFSTLSKRPNTTNLKLSVTYRCPKKVVEKINTVYDVVEAAPDAEEGKGGLGYHMCEA